MCRGAGTGEGAGAGGAEDIISRSSLILRRLSALGYEVKVYKNDHLHWPA